MDRSVIVKREKFLKSLLPRIDLHIPHLLRHRIAGQAPGFRIGQVVANRFNMAKALHDQVNLSGSREKRAPT